MHGESIVRRARYQLAAVQRGPLGHAAQAEPARLAPHLNQDGAEILRQAGFTPDEIAALVRDGVTRPAAP